MQKTDAEKANTQAALQGHTRASKASKVHQDIKMTDNATTQQDNTEDVELPPNPCGKVNIQVKLNHTKNIELYVQSLY